VDPEALERRTGVPVLSVSSDSWLGPTLRWLEAARLSSLITSPGLRPTPDEGYCPSPDTELVTVTTADGVDLAGAVYEHPIPHRRRNATIVLTHGSDGNFYEGTLFWLARCLAADGYTAVSLNRRDADGRMLGATLDHARQDLAAAISYAERRKPANRIYLFGHSLGSVVVAHYLAVTPAAPVSGVVLASAIASYPEFRQARLPDGEYERALAFALAAEDPSRRLLLPWCEELARRLACPAAQHSLTEHTVHEFLSYFGPTSQAAPRDAMGDVRVPILILRSEADRVTPCQDSLDIMAASFRAPSATLVELYDKLSDGTLARSRLGHALTRLRRPASETISQWVKSVGHWYDGGALIPLTEEYPRLRIMTAGVPSDESADPIADPLAVGGPRVVAGHPCTG
jgi:alpha-beta hydrolase superfamily lysophospholipase